jgi:chromo domain-containing protein 1
MKHSKHTIGIFDVDRILAEKVEHRKKFYLIRWTGYKEEESTWEPKTNIGLLALEEWSDRRRREALGTALPFDVTSFDNRARKLQEEAQEGQEGQEAQRKRLENESTMKGGTEEHEMGQDLGSDRKKRKPVDTVSSIAAKVSFPMINTVLPD